MLQAWRRRTDLEQPEHPGGSTRSPPTAASTTSGRAGGASPPSARCATSLARALSRPAARRGGAGRGGAAGSRGRAGDDHPGLPRRAAAAAAAAAGHPGPAGRPRLAGGGGGRPARALRARGEQRPAGPGLRCGRHCPSTSASTGATTGGPRWTPTSWPATSRPTRRATPRPPWPCWPTTSASPCHPPRTCSGRALPRPRAPRPRHGEWRLCPPASSRPRPATCGAPGATSSGRSRSTSLSLADDGTIRAITTVRVKHFDTFDLPAVLA